MPVPTLTLCLSALTLGLMLLPQTLQTAFYLNIEQGPWWNRISGHWIHADFSHLSWNLIALLVLGSLIERHSRTLLLAGLAAGMLGVNMLLLSPLADIQYYCGLSGVLNTLLGVALYRLWKTGRHPVLPFVAALCLAKIALEVAFGDALLTEISVASYPLSHLAGLLATPLAFWITAQLRQFQDPKVSDLFIRKVL